MTRINTNEWIASQRLAPLLGKATARPFSLTPGFSPVGLTALIAQPF